MEEGEQKHFEQAIGQLERFVEDKILVCRRERASIAEKLRSARARRDEIVGSTARDRIEAEILKLATREESLRNGGRLALWNREKMRSTENGETNTTSFATGRRR